MSLGVEPFTLCRSCFGMRCRLYLEAEVSSSSGQHGTPTSPIVRSARRFLTCGAPSSFRAAAS
eukprot:269082-Amphidinium_carterae.1